MKTLVVRSFFFINFFRKNRLPEVTILLSHFLTSHQFLALLFLKFCVTVLTVTSDDVCCNIRNVKYKMKMFVTAVCFLFLLKLKWPKDKSIYDVTFLFCILSVLTRLVGLISTKTKEYFLAAIYAFGL